jgi:hypothetical protein
MLQHSVGACITIEVHASQDACESDACRKLHCGLCMLAAMLVLIVLAL